MMMSCVGDVDRYVSYARSQPRRALRASAMIAAEQRPTFFEAMPTIAGALVGLDHGMGGRTAGVAGKGQAANRSGVR